MKKQLYTRHSTVPIWMGLEAIEDHLDMPEKKERVLLNGIPVHVTSLRLRTFYHDGIVCKCCGMPATHFAIEKDAKSKHYHLNLWGMKGGEEVIFTHDHILALSNGGADKLENCQTMCGPCNRIKGNK